MSTSSAPFFQNLYFDENYYLTEKAKALNANGEGEWTAATTAQAIADAHMTPWEHFSRFGAFEQNANGAIGINPSPFFSVSDYLSSVAYVNYSSLTAAINEVREAGDPITHYATKGYIKNCTVSSVEEGDMVVFPTRHDLNKTFYFNEGQYLENKAAALSSINFQGQSWTAESTAKALANAGMTAWEHFVRFGAFEQDAFGDIGIDPSQYFDISRYYSDKADLIGSSVEDVIEAFHAAHLDPISHYTHYGFLEQLTPRATGLDPIYMQNESNVPPRSGDALIDSLLIREDTWASMNRIAGDDNIVHYHFLSKEEIATEVPIDYPNETPMTEAQIRGFEQAFEVLAKMTGISFEETSRTDNAQIICMNANLGISSGITYTGFGTKEDAVIVALDNTGSSKDANANPVFGTPGFETICHELGHALGLEHPFAKQMDADHMEHTNIPKSIETKAMTIMSYEEGNSTSASDGTIVAPWCENGTFYYSPQDILALQYLYGTDGINGSEGVTYDDVLA
ncbi:MAG: hypothetical protein IJU76_04250 [Desulfovibrionaceae bacterium]|nr:hypothetical protein [Desulfovibrionaceae bacterium]